MTLDPKAKFRGEKDRRQSRLHWLLGAIEDDDGVVSMTRCVALLFALVLCFGIVIMALQDHLHGVGWPFAVLGSVTLLAVPLQALFRTLAEWFRSKPGSDLIGKLVGKIADVDVGSVAKNVAGTVETRTTVTPPDDDAKG